MEGFRSCFWYNGGCFVIGPLFLSLHISRKTGDPRQLIPFDEMLEAMYAVGRGLPLELRETALGGCAATPSGCRMGCCVQKA